MIVIINHSKKKVKATREYICRGCSNPILIGELYIHERYLDSEYRKWVSNRYHSITCEFEHIERQFETQRLYNHLEAHYDATDCIYTTEAINPMTEEVSQYDDEDY